MDQARELILQFGWNSTVYQILNPGIRHWFSSKAPGLVGYVCSPNALVAAGGPVCAAEDLPIVTREFERYAAAQNRTVCYVAAAARLDAFFQDSPNHSRITIGAQPAWNPNSWPAVLQARPSLRAQLARARNKGVTIAAVSAEVARRDARLRRCLAEWLAARPLPPMHFLVEPQTLDGPLTDRIVLVAQRGNTPVAFLLASPVPLRRGYLIEQIARSPAAPNGTAELLIDALMTRLIASGHAYLTMGLVALSQHAQGEIRRNPPWLRALMTWARAHGQRFYHFRGLEAFRQKMLPDYWENIYAISNEPQFSPVSFHAMLAAFSGTPVSRMAFRAARSAIATEARWLTQSLRNWAAA